MSAPLLFTPLPLRGLTLSNRAVVAPMCQYSAIDGCAEFWHLQHYGALAASGPGLVMLEATAVVPDGRISAHDLGLWDDATEEALTALVGAMKACADTPIGIQLAHAGRKGSTPRPWSGTGRKWETVAPSALPFELGQPAPRALEAEELPELVQAFVDAALRAVRIGFDVIELHSAHGYLLHQFLSPLSNRREDAYGGSLDNRMRFPLEVVERVRAALPEDYPLGVRISATDWAEGGFTLDEAAVYALAFAKLGADYVCVSSGGLVPQAKIPMGPGYQVPLAERIRAETGLVTRAVGLITDPHQAEAILAEGKADCVALGRAFLDDPRWCWRAARALGADIAYPPQYRRAKADLWPGAKG
jgi:2,4-dienoyl-CoA reductase-like NADH-dependent reductase (Old Yellow Enzyme family)